MNESPTQIEIDKALEQVVQRSTHIAYSDYRHKLYEKDIDFKRSNSTRAKMRRLLERVK